MAAASMVACCLAGCGGGTLYTLSPPATPAAPPAAASGRQGGPASSPVGARVVRAGVTPELDRPGAALQPESRLVVEIELTNADPVWPASVGRPSLRVEDALGGPPVWAGPMPYDNTGMVPAVDRGAPPPVLSAGMALPPRSTTTVWVVFAGFPRGDPAAPVRAVVFVPVQGRAPLELAIADLVPGGPRWLPQSRLGAWYLTGGFGSARNSETLNVYDLGFAYRRSWGRLIAGGDYLLTRINREALAGGPPSMGVSLLADVRWQTWGAFGFYAEGGAFFGFESPPSAYDNVRGQGTHYVLLPRVGAGLVIAGGALSRPTLFPVLEPLSAQRRFGLRLGFVQWFNVGQDQPVWGVQMSFEAVVKP